MSRLYDHRLSRLLNAGQQRLLQASWIGLEKESLRVAPDGHIAQTPHPAALGAALTHPQITTDYSEALLEFITPPVTDTQEALKWLSDIHQFVYQRLSNEMLWPASMPCVVAGEKGIPIAWYGSSNLGMFKHIYRRGLSARYGRMMQVIAGVHFNFSLADSFWQAFQDQEQDERPLQEFRSDGYFGLIRNLQRFGWLIPYLFGASPAVCKSFLAGQPTNLLEFDANTAYQPYATSLRVSDIGYTNRREKKTGLSITYDDLTAYLTGLNQALNTPCPDYERLGIVVDDEYRQLNANRLQVEAEYYSSVRPKQVPQADERPVLALQRRGVQYVELRSLDVNVFTPLGVDEQTLRFLQAFMLFCLLHESPPISEDERQEIDDNQLMVANQGRAPDLCLRQQGRPRRLRDWALELSVAMEGICEILDNGRVERPYRRALTLQQEAIYDPALTPSARVLAEMRGHGECFFEFAKRLAQQHQAWFQQLPVNAERTRFFEQAAKLSWQQQRAIEEGDTISFPEYLRRYFTAA